MKKNNIKKDFIWNTIGSALHSFNSLFFLIIVTRVNGIDTAGYFSYGFTISNIFLTIATFGGRTFQVTDSKKEFDDNLYISFRYLTTFITLFLSILFFLLFKYPSIKYITIILLIVTRVFESLSDVYFGFLQKNNKLYIVGKSLFYKNLLSLIFFVGFELLFKNLSLSVISWSIINLFFLLFVDIRNYNKIKSREKFKFTLKCSKIFNGTLYFFIFNFLSIFVLNMPRYFIEYYLTDELQGIYGILIMPATMIILLTQFVLQPFATRLAESNKNKTDDFRKQSNKIFISIIIISLTSIVISCFIGIPLLNLIYNLDLNKYRFELLLVMTGASFYALNTFMSLIYTIKRKIKYQFIVYGITLGISLILSNYLVSNYYLLGGILSYLFIMLEIFVFYMVKYKRGFNK